MKHAIFLVLLLWTLCMLASCHLSSEPSEKDTAAGETMQTAVPPLTDDMIRDARYWSGAQSYQLTAYETPVFLKLYSFSCFSRDGFFYGDTGGGFIKFTNSGDVVETIDIQAPELSLSPDTGKTMLENGNFVVMETLLSPAVYLLDGAGAILAETVLSQSSFIMGLQCVIRSMDTSVYIMQGNYIYIYDTALTLQKSYFLDDDYHYGMHIQQDGTVILGNTARQLKVFDPKTGEVSPYPQSNLPDMLADAEIRFGADDHLYYFNDMGIYSIEEDGTPIVLFLWADGSAKANSFLQILDSTHVLVYTAPGLDGESAYYLMKPSDRTGDVSERRVMTLWVLSYDANDFPGALVDTFNRTNEDYYIEATFFPLTELSQAYEEILEVFLFGGDKPDMLWLSCGYYRKLSETLGDKNAFVNLRPYYEDAVWQGLPDAYTQDGVMPFLPLGILLKTLCSKDGTAGEDGTLSLTELSDIAETLDEGQALFSDPEVPKLLYEQAIMDFVDFENKDCSFDTEEFRSFIRFTERVETEYTDSSLGYFNQYVINDEIIAVNTLRMRENLQNGNLRFMHLSLSNPRQYAAAKLIWGETEFSLCGYPRAAGSGAVVTGEHFLGICADSHVKGGADAFIRFALSYEAQTAEKLTDVFFPVTRNAAEALLEKYHYYSLKDEDAWKPYTRWNSELQKSEVIGTCIQLMTYETPPYEDNSALAADFYARYEEIELTDVDKTNLLSFFDSCAMYGKVDNDSVIAMILEEELSAYAAGVKTLETVSRQIQSRVWIYLNE